MQKVFPSLTPACSMARRPSILQRVQHCSSQQLCRRIRTRATAPGPPTWRFQDELGPTFTDLANSLLEILAAELGPDLDTLPVEEKFVNVNAQAEDMRFLMQNVFYTSRVFRKIHLELAVGPKGMQVIHFVMFPWPEYSIPLLSLDMVGFGPRVTLAIADACPATADLSLPPAYSGVRALRAGALKTARERALPEWGAECLSQECVCISPQDESEICAFGDFAKALLRLHLEAAKAAAPAGDEAARRTREAQERYCRAQLRNDKTRLILARCLGGGFADEYMETVLFDVGERTPLHAPLTPSTE